MHIGFIDPEKAFERVNRSKLWVVLDKRSYPTHLINILEKNIYNETKVKTESGYGWFSQEIVINKRVRQGCITSLILYNIYRPCLKGHKNEINPDIKSTNNVTVNVLLSADDMVIL